MPLVYAGVPGPERHERAKTVLEAVGLGDRLQHRPNELSGGECQRVAVARALVAQPDLVLADEPTGNLDRRTGDEILGLLEKLNAEGVALVMVTHDLEKAARAQRILRISDSTQKHAKETVSISGSMEQIQQLTLKTSEDSAEASMSIGKLTDMVKALRTSVAGFKLPGAEMSDKTVIHSVDDMEQMDFQKQRVN